MKVVEIFKSIDGEGKRAGLPTTFLRLAGCNLRCTYCFGVRPGRRNPELRLGYKHNPSIGDHSIKLTDVKVGDWVMTYDDDLNLVETEVISAESRKVTSWIEFKISGKDYFVTPEHPFFTIHGIKTAENIQIGDIILDVKPNQLLSYNASINNCMKNPEVVANKIANTDYASISSKMQSRMRAIWDEIHCNIESGVPIASWSPSAQSYYQTSLEFNSEENRKRSSERMSGSNNPNWKGGSKCSNYDMLRAMISAKEIVTSWISGKTPEEDNASMLVVHHVDENRSNDAIENLIVVTSREHNRIHERGYSFWKGDRKDGKRLSSLCAANGKVVEDKKHVDITKHPHYGREYGPKDLTVYTLSCAPYNTYLIDDMWVHNCDTSYAFDKSCAEDLSVDQIIEKLKDKGISSITITGGEPLVHPHISTLLAELNKTQLFDINIETNGTIDPSKYHKLEDVWFTVDYKCPSSGEEEKMNVKAFETLRKQDVLKFVVGSEEDLNRSLEVIERYQPAAQIYFSPVFGFEPSKIVEFLLQKQLYHCKIQLQMHKYIFDPNARGV